LRRSIADTVGAVNLKRESLALIIRALAATITCLLFSSSAGAHPEFAPTTVNRYLKLDLVAPSELRLAYTVMVGTEPAARWRRAADANADGKLDEAETRALGERARAAVSAGLKLSVDGRPVHLGFEPPIVGLAGAEVAPSPFSVDLVARVPLPGTPPHVLRVDDTTPEPQLGETEIRIDESPTTRLIRAHRGPTGSERQTRFLFRGQKFSALEERSITVEMTACPAAPPSATAAAPRASSSRAASRALALAGAVTALVGAAVVLLLWRLRRRRYRRMNG
jgi:hypothetical protein